MPRLGVSSRGLTGVNGARIDLSRLRFLVVEDNTYMRRIIRALLHGYGVREVLEAEDGAAGLDSFSTNSPNVVITDWHMPILDGLEMARILRHPETSSNPDVPIVMVSGHAEKKRVVDARNVGVSAFLVKPISTRALYDRVVTAVAVPRPDLVLPQEPEPPSEESGANDLIASLTAGLGQPGDLLNA